FHLCCWLLPVSQVRARESGPYPASPTRSPPLGIPIPAPFLHRLESFASGAFSTPWHIVATRRSVSVSYSVRICPAFKAVTVTVRLGSPNKPQPASALRSTLSIGEVPEPV